MVITTYTCPETQQPGLETRHLDPGPHGQGSRPRYLDPTPWGLFDASPKKMFQCILMINIGERHLSYSRKGNKIHINRIVFHKNNFRESHFPRNNARLSCIQLLSSWKWPTYLLCFLLLLFHPFPILLSSSLICKALETCKLPTSGSFVTFAPTSKVKRFYAAWVARGSLYLSNVGDPCSWLL